MTGASSWIAAVFWMNVSWFGKKAETAGRLLKKGAAVVVIGDLHAEIWVDKDTGEQKAAYKVNADEVSLDMRSLADVTLPSAQRRAWSATAA